MRICNKCHIDIGESGYRVHIAKTDVDFCSDCFREYQQLSNQLERKMDNELLEWIGGEE